MTNASNQESPKKENDVLHIQLGVYERAQETALHNDMIMWQAAAIAWAANALLLDFAYRSVERSLNPALAILIPVLGVALTSFVLRVFHALGKVKRFSFCMCRQIECQFPKELRLHTRINDDDVYAKGFGWRWVLGISSIFLAMWGVVLFMALCSIVSGIR